MDTNTDSKAQPKSSIKAVTVFCGSSSGRHPEYLESAKRLGAILASRNIHLVYGGGAIGLMGEIAKSTIENGGQVLGIIPEAMKNVEGSGRESIPGVSEIVVKSMHERKQLLNHHCSAFIAMPGGYGTFDELFEVITWAQLNIHRKPIALLNTRGYFDHLVAMVDNSVTEGFVRPEGRNLLIVERDPEQLLAKMEGYEVPRTAQYGFKWTKDQGGMKEEEI
ncbi:hypothetical protein M427DRAFT_119728 [Gonapodya prolifera JEL478]|uniref:Cytokinin riboside 5'-monophosphate phosphoribohydrolase n=1 Tax=Gonapodya prolifera (strain JEL478) TaxID=1344416 RepID=A0A139AV11_GONPJ|nr:hypothetical protein M427DRAFT_119728 [Gonapodya prolifera JEL478]|eukprot:KXS20571.1 hypothetical protein M427DRAFT_119728 [Gonapodya prolifera JEL478]